MYTLICKFIKKICLITDENWDMCYLKNVCKTYVETLFWKKIQLFRKRKSLTIPLFMGLCETIYHDIVYISYHCHMDNPNQYL